MSGVKLGPNAVRQIRDTVRKVNETDTMDLGEDLLRGTFNQSPEVYFALTPETGIPARVGTTLGKATCKLYRGKLADETDGSGTRTLEAMEDATGTQEEKVVHNLSFAKVGVGAKYVPVWREKNGTWFTVDPRHVVGFVLTEKVPTVDDFPVKAYLLDEDGSITSEEVDVQSDPVLRGIFGPAAIGFRGWAVPVESSGSVVYSIVHMQRFAEYILFQASFGGSCEAAAEVTDFWHGESPSQGDWLVKVKLTWADCECLQTEIGIAVLDEIESGYPYLWYKVVAYDQVLNVGSVDECAEGGYSCSGSPTRTLLFGKGLSLGTGGCSSSSCTYVLSADGLQVVGVDCDDVQTSKGGVRTLSFASPLSVSMGEETECLGTATVGLPSTLFDSDCLDINYNAETCKFEIDLPANLVTAGAGIAVAANGCGYVVSTTGVDTGIVEGTCISFDVDGDTVTINNTMEVVAGDGISVTPVGCTRVVSLDGSDSTPQVEISALCDVTISQSPISIACVSDGQGGYTFTVTGGEITLTKKYVTVSLPARVVGSYSSECAGSGSSGSGSSGSGSSGSGGTEYTGEFFEIQWVDCDDSNPDNLSSPLDELLFVLHTVPTGAAYFVATTRNLSTGQEINGQSSYLETPEEWHILVPEADVGDTIRLTVTFYNSSGVAIDSESDEITCQ